jgi:hypothetical protein
MGVHGALVAGIPGLKRETWDPLRVFRHGAFRRKRASRLDLFGGLRDGRGGGLEAYFGMGSVAEWLVDRCTAATERDGGLASKIDLLTVGVNQLDWTFHAQWSVWSHRDCYFTLSHEHPSLEI